MVAHGQEMLELKQETERLRELKEAVALRHAATLREESEERARWLAEQRRAQRLAVELRKLETGDYDPMRGLELRLDCLQDVPQQHCDLQVCAPPPFLLFGASWGFSLLCCLTERFERITKSSILIKDLLSSPGGAAALRRAARVDAAADDRGVPDRVRAGRTLGARARAPRAHRDIQVLPQATSGHVDARAPPRRRRARAPRRRRR